MSTLQRIENLILDVYEPVKAVIIYRNTSENDTYVESFDFDQRGQMINAHPLSTTESAELGKILIADNLQKNNFLQSNGLTPKNVLYVNTAQNGFAVWHTSALETNLFFLDSLTIPSGLAQVPPMIWKASKNRLQVFAMTSNRRPILESRLFQAPFFNVNGNGDVCMGNVQIEIDQQTSLESFMLKWQSYFFGSVFTHLHTNSSPVKGNIVQLWQNLIGSATPFPVKTLLKTSYTLKKLIL